METVGWMSYLSGTKSSRQMRLRYSIRHIVSNDYFFNYYDVFINYSIIYK